MVIIILAGMQKKPWRLIDFMNTFYKDNKIPLILFIQVK